MKLVLVGALCGLAGGVIGAVAGGEVVGRAMPSSGDQWMSRVSGSYAVLAGPRGGALPPAEVRSQAISQFAQQFIAAGAMYPEISESQRPRMLAIAREALESGLLDEIPEADLRRESLVWARCLGEPAAAPQDVPQCVVARKSISAPASQAHAAL